MSISITGGDLVIITIIAGYFAVQIAAIRALRDVEKAKATERDDVIRALAKENPDA